VTFSGFGLILFELLAGRRAFQGETAVETMTAILKNETPDLPDTVPPGVRQMVHHCLEKRPENRFQSARDLSFALAAISQSGAAPALKASSRRSWPGLQTAGAALAVIALSIATYRWLARAPEAETWSGSPLGGPAFALDPRISPDGRLLPFQAMVRGQMQVAVMTPESGNWSVLTNNRELGSPMELTWSRDGGSLYYDRVADVPRGIFSVPVLGGEEKLVLENAMAPEALPDGSLLVYRLNAQRNLQLFRYWPENGRLQDLPVICRANVASENVRIRATPDGTEAVVSGTALGRENEPDRLLAVDIDTGRSRPLTPPGVATEGNAAAVSRDGKSLIVAVLEDALRRVVSTPMKGKLAFRILFTTTSWIWFLDTDPAGRVYVSATEPNDEMARYSATGQELEVVPFPSGAVLGVASLPDGRAIVPVRGLGRDRLVAFADGKNPVPLVATTEETSAPITPAGSSHIAFMIGPAPHTSIAVAETGTGRITNRIVPGKGEISSISSSPDGKTLYFSAGGKIWSAPSAGGQAGLVRAGDLVTADPNGRDLVIATVESARMRLFLFPLNGSAQHEIVPDGSAPLTPGNFGGLGGLRADGRLLVILAPVDSWSWVPGILDIHTGRITRLPWDQMCNTFCLNWMPDGQIVEIRQRFRSTLWRFQPAGK